MAGKVPPGAGGYPYPQGPPPPYQTYPQVQPAGVQSTNVVVQGGGQTTVVQTGAAKPVVVQQKPARGFFGSVMKEVNLLGKQVSKEIDYVGNKINETVDASDGNPLLKLFQTGNVVQLVSRSSGRTLQILVGTNGQLVVDGNGPNSPDAFNTAWTVVSEGNNQVRLHNNNNYLTIINGHTTIINMPPGLMHGVETKLQLGTMENFVVMSSLKELGRYVGILPDGQLKPALACGREKHAQFGVQLLSSPYPHGATAVTVVKK